MERSPSSVYFLAALLLGLSALPVSAGKVILADNFTNSSTIDNPWSCVDHTGKITMMVGHQMAVDDQGAIKHGGMPFGPSVAIADLNGDGLPDLIVADSVGYFWYFQNHGTKTAPKFTTPEVMPIWLGDPSPDPWLLGGTVANDIVPSVQLVDFNGDGLLDLVVGTYPGKLYYIPNQGSAIAPAFKLPDNLADITVPTRSGGTLWCNYLAPCLYDWRHLKILDLVMGEGSYSANSIFFFANKGTSDKPVFDENSMAKIIPGMGREHLAPKVISWNGDGKADILTMERVGFLNLFLNQGNAPDTKFPTFDQGRHIPVGGQEKMDENSTVNVGSLTGSPLPGLIIGKTDGHIYVSQNTGQPNNFVFGPPVPLMGTPNTRPQIHTPIGWRLDGGYGSPYDLLVCTNAQVEPSFTPPDPTITSAMRFYVDEPAQPNPTFPEHFYPQIDVKTINRTPPSPLVRLQGGIRYKLSFWVRADGDISNMTYQFWGPQYETDGARLSPDINIKGTVNPSGTWDHFSTSVSFQSMTADPHGPWDCYFRLVFSGKGSLYIAGFRLEEAD